MVIAPSEINSIESGLDLILSDLSRLLYLYLKDLRSTEYYYLAESISNFPWRISTYVTGGKQIVVNSREEALARFKQSNLLDCRISAYPYPVPTVEGTGINAQIPNFFLSDIDRKNFESDRLFQQCLQNTLQNYKVKLHGANPTVLWSGGGYQLLQPLDADIILETVDIFSKFDERSMKLMRYLERLVTDGKCDPVHNGTVAFSNCMIRIPFSYNSKYIQLDDKGQFQFPAKSQVKVVYRSDDFQNWPNIRYALEGLWTYLIQERNDEALRRLHSEQKRLRFDRKYPNSYQHHQPSKINWIDKLLQNPLDDFRKYCITFVFTPYFINVKRLPHSDAFNLMKDWLDKCSFFRRLDFNARQRINEAIKGVGSYPPKPPDKLKVENMPLYTRLQREGIIIH